MFDKMLMSAITVIISILVSNVAAHHGGFHNHREVYDYHWPNHHNFPENHHSPQNHHWPDHRPNDHHQSYDWGSPEYFDDDHDADDYGEGNYYPWSDRNEWDGKGWSSRQEMKPSSSRTPTTQNPQPQPDLRSQCIRSCPATSEYNPVCGTNYLMYDNIGKLECAKFCGVDVSLMRRSQCPLVPSQNLPTAPSTTTTAGVPPELTFDERIKEITE